MSPEQGPGNRGRSLPGGGAVPSVPAPGGKTVPPVRILHLMDSLDAGGAQESLSILLRHSERRRFEFHVASLHGRGEAARRMAEAGAEVHALASGRFSPLILFRLARLLRRLRPAVLHTHLVVSDILGALLAGPCGVGVLVSHARSEDPFRFQQGMLSPLHALAMRRSKANIAVSEEVACFLRDKERVSPERIRVIHNAPELAECRRTGEEQRRRFRESLGLTPGAFVVGTACRLDPNKGLLHFIEAMAMLKDRIPALHGLIAGEGPQSRALEKKIAESGLRGRVIMPGFLPHDAGLFPNIYAMYASLDLFALPSYFEGFPVSVLEAMAVGRPVVATEVSGLRGNFRNGEDIVFVPMRDSRGLAEAIHGLYSAPERARKMAEKAGCVVEARFSPGRMAAAVEDLYSELLGGPGNTE